MYETKVALIPCYEPDQTLIHIVEQLRFYNYHIVVVDDGSGPLYQHIFQQVALSAHLIQYSKNRGKGYALKKGFSFIKNVYPNSVIVTLDSDGQHSVRDAGLLIKNAMYHPDTMYLGCRKLNRDVPLKSKLGNSLTRLVYKSLTGVRVYDTQTGLRAFSSDWLDLLLSIKGDRYEYEMNQLLYIAKHKLPFKELPIHTIYFDKTNSVSHFNPLRDSAKIYGEIFKFAGSSLASFGIDYLLYSLLILVLGSQKGALLAANLGARAVSSIFNFTLNKRLVFQSKGNLLEESLKYFALVLFNICLNSLILEYFASLGWNVFFAKILVELLMFVFSYLIQHSLIFKKRKEPLCHSKESTH